MLKAVLIAGAVVFAATPVKATENDTVHYRCGTKITWSAVKCVSSFWDAVTRMKTAAKYERWAKHAEVDGELGKVAEYRNYVAFHAAESARMYMLWLQQHPMK